MTRFESKTSNDQIESKTSNDQTESKTSNDQTEPKTSNDQTEPKTSSDQIESKKPDIPELQACAGGRDQKGLPGRPVALREAGTQDPNGLQPQPCCRFCRVCPAVTGLCPLRVERCQVQISQGFLHGKTPSNTVGICLTIKRILENEALRHHIEVKCLEKGFQKDFSTIA